MKTELMRSAALFLKLKLKVDRGWSLLARIRHRLSFDSFRLRTAAKDFDNQKGGDDLLRFLQGKRVAVVGPAASYLGSDYGAEIDRHDVVVRVNVGIWDNHVFRRSYGSRTDVLVCNFNPSNRRFLAKYLKTWRDIRYLVVAGFFDENVFATNDCTTQILLSAVLRREVVFCMDVRGFFNEFRKKWDSVPNTGTMAVAFLLSTKIKSLSIYGFDFYRSEYNQWQEEAIRTLVPNLTREQFRAHVRSEQRHFQADQRNYFEKYVYQDPRVTFVMPRAAIARGT